MVMAAFGAGVGSLVCGYIQDSWGTRKTAFFNIASVICGFGIMSWYNLRDEFTL